MPDKNDENPFTLNAAVVQLLHDVREMKEDITTMRSELGHVRGSVDRSANLDSRVTALEERQHVLQWVVGIVSPIVIAVLLAVLTGHRPA